MITNINEKNSNQYQALFEKATLDLAKYTRDGEEASTSVDPPCFEATQITFENESDFFIKKEEEIILEKISGNFQIAENYSADAEYYTLDEAITSLSDYFSNIETLALINPQLYTRLPIDENFFEIDANSRNITIPSEFKNIGIGVSGDHRAEYLWFKIKRYYDATDLSTKFCRIEWNVGKKKGISELWGSDGSTEEQAGYDLQSFPGYIVFGWCVTDYLTSEDASSIQFAIRFFETQDSKTYSFSTLPATLSIKKTLNYSLDFDESEYIHDTDGLLKDRFENKLSSTDTERALKPLFSYVMVNGKKYEVTESAPYTMNLNTDNDQTSEWFGTCAATVVYPVSAYSTDGGKISYSWKKTNPDDTRDIKAVTYKTDYIQTEDAVAVSGKRYYLKNLDGTYSDLSTTIKEQTDAGIAVFERVSLVNIDEAGRYTVIVKNRAGKDTNSIEQVLVVVNKAKEPVFENEPVTSGVIELNSPVVLTAKAIPVEEKGAVITYKWQKKALDGKTPYVTVAESKQNYYSVTEPGFYKVSAINSINKTTAVTNSPIESRITLAPVEPEVSIDKTEIFASTSDIVTVTASIPESAGEVHIVGEEITYQWYKVINNAEDAILEGETAKTYIAKDSERGYRVYCVVTNNYNGKTAIKNTEKVLVNA